ncbi:hypothetical protein [Streptomyces sp. NPDC056730]|uniref:hypothetical protein n=1 Tax=Streptomyces sp. NPDC056730 TaxID=3345929 RepID=UPI00367C3787
MHSPAQRCEGAAPLTGGTTAAQAAPAPVGTQATAAAPSTIQDEVIVGYYQYLSDCEADGRNSIYSVQRHPSLRAHCGRRRLVAT